MRWFAQRKYVFLVINIVGLIAVAAVIAYIFLAASSGLSETSRNLWLTFAVEIVLIWVTIVAFDRLIGSAQTAKERRGDTRGYLNYVGRIMHGMAPWFSHWNEVDLENEHRWGVDYVDGLVTPYLSPSERQTFNELMQLIDEVRVAGSELTDLAGGLREQKYAVDREFEQARRVRDGHPRQYQIDDLSDLEQLVDLRRDDREITDEELAELQSQIGAVSDRISEYELAPEVERALEAWLSHVRETFVKRYDLQSKIADYHDRVRKFEYALVDLDK